MFYITGSLGVLLAVVIFFGVREPPRGGTEPEMAGLEQITTYRFSGRSPGRLFKKRTLRLLFIQGFFGVFPWNVITFWFFTYLEKERGYTGTPLFVTMAAAVIVLAVGYPVGGALGDRLFQRTPRGRAIVSTIGVLAGAVLLWVTMSVPDGQPVAVPGDAGADRAVHPLRGAQRDLHRVRRDLARGAQHGDCPSRAFIESAGAALSPLIAGFIADRSSLGTAILLICVSTWLLCALFFVGVAFVVPGDIRTLRAQMQARASRAGTGPAESGALKTVRVP